MSMIEAALALVDSRGGGGTAMTMDPEQASPESTSPKAATAMTMGQEQTSPESTSPEAVTAMTMGPESSEGILPSVHICGSRHRGEFSGKSGQSCHDERPKRFILQWHITHRCNLSCVHCYQNDDVCCAPYESLLDVLDKYERFLQANHYYAYIYLTGGEPLTHPDFFPLLKELRRKQFLTGFLTEFLTAFLTGFLTELLKDFLTDTKGFFRRLCPVEKPGFQDW